MSEKGGFCGNPLHRFHRTKRGRWVYKKGRASENKLKMTKSFQVASGKWTKGPRGDVGGTASIRRKINRGAVEEIETLQ